MPSPAAWGIAPDRWDALVPLMTQQALASGSPANNPRVPSAEDVSRGRFVAVLNESTARKLFAGAKAVGKTVNAGGQQFQVIGVVDAFNQSRIISSNAFNLSAVTIVAIIFVLITIPQARFVDRLIERDNKRIRAGGWARR